MNGDASFLMAGQEEFSLIIAAETRAFWFGE